MYEKIKKLLKSFCTILGALVLISGIFSCILNYYRAKNVYIPEHTMLVLNFDDPVTETGESSLLDEIMQTNSLNFVKLLQAIEFAAHDKNIDGLVARINTTNLDMAQVQEIAGVVEKLKKSGKRTIVHSRGFGPLGQGNREYYLASFFDKIYMQPHTNIGLTGINIEVPFARSVLDKIGVYPEFYARYEYKNAMVSLTDKNMPATYRENMQALIKSLMETLQNNIEKNRLLTEKFTDIINQAPLTAEQGKKINLIDDILYLSEVEDILKNEGVENFADIREYAELIQPNTGNLPQIAVLNINGIINDGENATDIDGELVVGSDSILADIAAIEELDDLKAVVVRINSPGGSYNAADEIYFALKKLKNDKKIPIIISQGGYAASGGYFISLAGDIIVTEPMTITGSIGVLGGKIVLQNLWKKLGINWQNVKVGKNSGIMSVNQPFNADEKRIFNTSLDEVYKDFTAKTLENRRLTKNIDYIARGKVWTGAQAVTLGLADDLGGYGKAMIYARQRGGLKPEERFKIATFPQQKSFKEKLYEAVFSAEISVPKFIVNSGVDIRYLKLFKRLQYDTVLLPFNINM